MRLVISSVSLPARLGFLVGVPDMESFAARLWDVEYVSREPSGNATVCISTDDTAVVGWDCNRGLLPPVFPSEGIVATNVVEGRLSELLAIEGLGGKGGRSSSSFLRKVVTLTSLLSLSWTLCSSMPISVPNRRSEAIDSLGSVMDAPVASFAEAVAAWLASGVALMACRSR